MIYDTKKILEDLSMITVCLDESMNITDKKYPNKPIIVVRSSYEHEQGDSLISRSRHIPGIKLKKGSVYGKYGLEVFVDINDNGNIEISLPENKEFEDRKDKKIATDFLKTYASEVTRIYNAKPGTKEYENAINDLIDKNNGKYIMRRNKE